MQSIMVTMHIKCANTNTRATVRLQPNRVGSQMCGPNFYNTIQIHYKHWQGLISSVWTNLGERQIADSLVHQQIGHHWRGGGDMRAKIFKHFNLTLDDISKFRNYRVKIRREICRCNLRESRLIPFGLASRPSFASPLLERLTLIVS